MAIFQRDNRHHTYADYLTWSRDYGDELINGVAYVREPPSPSQLHQEIVGEIYRQAANALKGNPSRVFVAPFDVRLPRADEADDDVDTVVQPDVLIVSDARKLDGRGVRGAPDWVVEVVSPGTARHDQTKKLSAYERAGVPEFWLVRPADRTVSIYRLSGSSYGRDVLHKLQGRTPVTSVPGVMIDWDLLPPDLV
jgi:Uma2 family endonuclease